MDTMESLHLAELLCARVCHDLSGPVGAAAAGAELIADAGGDDDTLELVATSAAAAAARLAYLRAAFGYGSQPQRPSAMRGMVEKYFGSLTHGALSPLVLDWQVADGELAAEAARALLNMVMTARDALPRGGRVTVCGEKGASGWNLSVTAAGEGVRLTEEADEVLVRGAALTGPRGAQAVLLRILSQRLGGALRVQVLPDSVSITLG